MGSTQVRVVLPMRTPAPARRAHLGHLVLRIAPACEGIPWV